MILDYHELQRVIACDRGPSGPPPGHRRTAVALTLFEHKHHATVLAIQKTDTEGYHWRNQIAFPGGHVAAVDRTETDAALRELQEELGIPSAEVSVLGPLGHFQTVTSNADLAVTVTHWNGQTEPAGDQREVARVLALPLGELIASHIASGFRAASVQSVGDRLIYPAPGALIWGVTARILHYFIELILRHTEVLGGRPT